MRVVSYAIHAMSHVSVGFKYPAHMHVSMKIARSRILGICACCKHDLLVDISEKLVGMRFELLKKAY